MKVALLSCQTIPSLELMGATLLAHHVNHVEKVLLEEFRVFNKNNVMVRSLFGIMLDS